MRAKEGTKPCNIDLLHGEMEVAAGLAGPGDLEAGTGLG